MGHKNSYWSDRLIASWFAVFAIATSPSFSVIHTQALSAGSAVQAAER